MANKIATSLKVIKTIKNHPVYFKDYFTKKNRGILTYRLRNGLRYKVRSGATDRFIVNEILIHKSYTPKGFEIRDTDTVVDIGAHIGIFSIMAAAKARNGQVFSFEPVQHNFNLLKENIRINNLSNIQPINKAVSDKNGKLTLFISQTRNKGQNSMFKLNEFQKEETVDKISFKQFLKKLEKIDFLKMDCEGAEYEIFPSLSKQEFAKIKKIAMEYHNYDERHGSEIKEILEKNGFKVKMIPEGKKFGTIYALK